jgi:hypothetical protein
MSVQRAAPSARECTSKNHLLVLHLFELLDLLGLDVNQALELQALSRLTLGEIDTLQTVSPKLVSPAGSFLPFRTTLPGCPMFCP